MNKIYMRKNQDDYPIKVREKVQFTFARQENAERVALALSFAGYFVRCAVVSSGYSVYVYTDREVAAKPPIMKDDKRSKRTPRKPLSACTR